MIMDYMYYRYMYWLIMLILVVYGGSIVDRDRRVSRIARGIAFLSVWAVIITGLVVVDKIQLFFLLLASLCCIAISYYSEGYLRILFGKISSLQTVIDLALALLIMFFTAKTLIELVVLWISVELLGFLLILLEKGFRNWSIATKYLILCATTGDISLFTWLAVSSLHLGFEKGVFADFHTLSMSGIIADPLTTFLLLIGFTTKLAQIPLHFWLVDTYTEAPSPVTALFSGLMSKMAVYGILRLYTTIALNMAVFTWLLLIQGFITIVYGFLLSVAQVDVKKMMAYSSMGHYGVMVMILSLLPITPLLAFKIIILYMLYHGLVKTQVFLNIGTIELLTNTRDMYRLGYLARLSPRIYNSVVIGFFSLAGMPPTIGFYAKLSTIVLAFSLLTRDPMVSFPLLVGMVFASILSIVYSIKYIGVYTSSYRTTPLRPVISIEWSQIYSEFLLALSLIFMTGYMIYVGVEAFIDFITTIVYIVGLVCLALSIYLYRYIVVKESKIWFGGIEV